MILRVTTEMDVTLLDFSRLMNKKLQTLSF